MSKNAFLLIGSVIFVTFYMLFVAVWFHWNFPSVLFPLFLLRFENLLSIFFSFSRPVMSSAHLYFSLFCYMLWQKASLIYIYIKPIKTSSTVTSDMCTRHSASTWGTLYKWSRFSDEHQARIMQWSRSSSFPLLNWFIHRHLTSSSHRSRDIISSSFVVVFFKFLSFFPTETQMYIICLSKTVELCVYLRSSNIELPRHHNRRANLVDTFSFLFYQDFGRSFHELIEN